MNKAKGFTLIELLVVVAIIALLSGVVLASLNAARAKARDAKRKVDVATIVKLVQSYFADTGNLLNPSAPAVCFSVNKNGSTETYGLDNGSAWFGGGSSPLIPAYISAVPSDPLYGSLGRGGNYMYFSPAYLGNGQSQVCAVMEGAGNGVAIAATCGTTVTYNYCINFY